VNRSISELEALRWLKEATASEPEIPPEVQARVSRHLSASLAGLSVGRLGAHSADASQLRSTRVTRHTSELFDNWRRVLTSRLAAWSAPALVVGAALGAAGHAAWVKEKTHTVYIDRVVTASPIPTTPSTPLHVDAPSITVESLPLDASSASAHAANTGRALAASAELRGNSVLSRERAVLDPARAALASGEPARALEHVRLHARQYPKGVLSEEREAIAINALVSLGKYSEATQRAAEFRARYPQSLMTYSVDAALAAIPQ